VGVHILLPLAAEVTVLKIVPEVRAAVVTVRWTG